MTKELFGAMVLVFITAFPLFAHGVHYFIEQHQAAVLYVRYDSGQPMAGAKVQIYDPAKENKVYQSGITDSHGRFAFLPDHKGEWIVVVNDQRGHGFRESFALAPINKKSPKAMAQDSNHISKERLDHHHSHESSAPADLAGLSWLQKLVMAVCVVWGFLGIYFFYRGKRMAARAYK